MKTFEELTNLEKSVLLIWGKELDYSTTAHFPIQRIKKKIQSTLQDIRIQNKKIQDKDIRRANKTLINSGFIIKHPTGRSTTYHLSPEGLRCCNILREENVI